MEEIKEFDHVRLADGREGAVVGVYGDGEYFDVDIGDSPATWDTLFSVKREEIEKVSSQ